MSTTELQTILGYLNIGLAIAHDSGVTIGHFGTTDFIQLAESVNTLLLSAIEPAASSTATSASTGSTVSTGSADSTAASAASSTVSSATADNVAPSTALVAVS